MSTKRVSIFIIANRAPYSNKHLLSNSTLAGQHLHLKNKMLTRFTL